LEMGARPIRGTEAEEILKAANLNGLSQVFYGGEQGLDLVIKQGANYVPNPAADVAKEVLDYLNREYSYGNRETRTGKALETFFGGLGYGWELDVLRLILATLFRAGAIEVSSKGQRFDSYLDPNSRVPFTNTPAFRAALFTPATPIDLKTLTKAVESYEILSGETVDVEKNAIAAAFKKLAGEDLHLLRSVEAEAKANKLPVIINQIEEFRTILYSVQTGAADDCARILAGEGVSIKEARDRVYRIREVTNDQSLAVIRLARVASEEMWPILARRENVQPASGAEELKTLLASETFYEFIPEIRAKAKEIISAYHKLYSDLHTGRAERFNAGIEQIKGCPEWASLPEEVKHPVLGPLVSRACQALDFTDGAIVCRNCSATVSQMESDQVALNGLKAQVLAHIQELTAPKEKLKRVRVAEFFTETLESREAVEKAVERLREQLLKLVDEGAKIILE